MKVLAKRLVRMDTGFALFDQHRPWVSARSASIDHFYWSRFRSWLQQQSWPGGVITGLDRSTAEILDLIGNPEETATWKRRGLVLGDVQSGKTATYSALICKAADAGYRFVILLTGTIENLRQQTQERLDAGFVGFDSSELLKRNKQNLRVGVGLLDATRQATVFTSSAADFRASTLEALGLSLSALREPALVVVKKHAKILANLREWVRGYNQVSQSDAIDIPMLLIDDEADNASINTNDSGYDPTAVNSGIRELLRLFRRTSYVGFTATPFANIFVNPDSKEEMLGDDLFPRDFIYTLSPPTNYFGPRRIFLDDVGGDLHLRRITDVDHVLPPQHRPSDEPSALPASLLDALCAFILSNAIRDLRREGPTHRSMLVNVSRFTNIQDRVEQLLHEALVTIQNDIRSFSSLDEVTALHNPSIRQLHSVFLEEYIACEFRWTDVQAALRSAALPITTRAVNQRTGSRALDYKAHKDTGLRVIAVGGNSLSRGLTLEGLSVSYFRRTTKMYDTLLQMGRWFGYRPGYEDLCRVWLPQEAIDWYAHISEAGDELRDELLKMRRLGRTPQDFGLAVRAHPDALLVTARNKMRTAREVARVVSVSGQAFESVELSADHADVTHNWGAVTAFANAIAADERVKAIDTDLRLFRGVDRAMVARLLQTFKVADTEWRFQPLAIAELLNSMPPDRLSTWDVVIPGGAGSPATLGPYSLSMQQRYLRVGDPPGSLVVSGTKRRVGSRGAEKAGLTSSQMDEASRRALLSASEEAELSGHEPAKRVNIADRFYRSVRTYPLLLLHVIEQKVEKKVEKKVEQEDEQRAETSSPPFALPPKTQLVALGLSFPQLDDGSAVFQATYRINLVKARELLAGVFDNDTEEEGDPDLP